MSTVIPHVTGCRHGVKTHGACLVVSCVECGGFCGPSTAKTVVCLSCSEETYCPPIPEESDGSVYGYLITVHKGKNEDSIRKWIEAWTGLENVGVTIS